MTRWTIYTDETMDRTIFRKSHYFILANIIKETKALYGDSHVLEFFQNTLEDVLTLDNPRFNRTEFEKACDVD